MTDLVGLVSECRVLLLDFDGPVCSVFSGISNRSAAEALVAELDSPPPSDLARTDDPFDILHFAASLGPAEATKIERRFTEIEIEAVRTARPTPDTAELIRDLWHRTDGLGVVSNNSAAAVDAYLQAHDLRQFVGGARRGIYARSSSDVSLLKPNPHMLFEALADLHAAPEECLFVGDSVSDIQAAHAAGVRAVAFANRPEKVQRFAEYTPAAIITSMRELYSDFLELF